jgi:hypothetical protein
MNRLNKAQARLDAARSLPDVLSASCQAFDQMLATIREHEDRAEGLFAAFVLAAASAADGRDALLTAPSLPWPPPAVSSRPAFAVGDMAASASDPVVVASIDDLADTMADLSQLINAGLASAASHALDPSDQAACTQGAKCAEAMWSLLARPGP